MELPQIKKLFEVAHGFTPKATMAKEGKLRYNFKSTITPEVSLTAHGLESSLTGMHYDRIICDDIITLKDRISRAERDKTKEMVNEIATNIIDPGKGSIWIGTPWHRDDAWNEINKFADIAMYPLSKNNFLGEEAAAQKKRTTTPFLYAANYELEIRKDENSLFTDPKMAEYWDYSKRAYAHVDAAFDGDHYCAMTILSPLDNSDVTLAKNLQGIGFAYPGNVKAWVKEIARYYRKYKCQYIYCETNPDKGYLANQLQKEGLRVRTYAESENKHIKISTNLYEYWGKLKVNVLSRDIDWFDTGTHDSLIQASSYVEAIEKRKGIKIACLEEIAFLKGFISKDQLRAQGNIMAKTGYGQYLLKLADGEIWAPEI